MKNISTRQKLFLIVCLNLFLCLPGLWVPFYNHDETTNTLYASFVNQGLLGLKDFIGSAYFLTHYLYILVYRFVAPSNFVAMHVIHALWKSLTCLALFWAGKNLDDEKTGLWAALFYCVFSTCFMSKDFHSPGAESLSLLPAALSAGFVFHGIRWQRKRDFFLAGCFAGFAYLFKAPMGVTLAAICLTVWVKGENSFRYSLFAVLGFLIVFLSPICFVWPPQEGLRFFIQKISETNSNYIQSYHQISFLYLTLKFLIRTTLVFVASFGMTVFALYALRVVFEYKQSYQQYWQKMFFLFVWFLFLLGVVTLGGRMFYHYFVFLFVPMPLLAASGVKQVDLYLISHPPQGAKDRFKKGGARFLNLVKQHMAFLMILPAAIFFLDGAFNYSSRPEKIDEAVHYIQTHTAQTDRIYVWGYMPQIYFFSQRLPSTVYFWSEFLAGSSPGSPAMEYVRATGDTLNVAAFIRKDFDPKVFASGDPDEFKNGNNPARLSDMDLLTLSEILSRITHSYWKKVFGDFLKHPPELFIDTSPVGSHGFGHYPIKNYELLKRFISDNYNLETVLDGLIIYRLKHT